MVRLISSCSNRTLLELKLRPTAVHNEKAVSSNRTLLELKYEMNDILKRADRTFQSHLTGIEMK